MDDAKLTVDGLPELRRSLRQVDKDLPKELAAGLAEASEIVLQAARPKVPTRSGRAQASMKVRKQQQGAALAVGGARAPYFPWLDFGGKIGRNNSQRRPFIKEGRYVYPALREKRDDVAAKVDEVMERLATQAGFDQTGKSTDG